jgi:hypothetical protein
VVASGEREKMIASFLSYQRLPSLMVVRGLLMGYLYA